MTVGQKRSFLINTAFIVVIILLIYFVLEFLFFYILPFVIGLLLASLVQKPAAKLSSRTKIPMGVSGILIILTLYLLIFTVIALIGYQLLIQLYNFIKSLSDSEVVPLITNALNRLKIRLLNTFSGMPPAISESIENIPETAFNNLFTLLNDSMTEFIAKLIKSAPGMLISTVITVIATCFIAKDYGAITRFIKLQFNAKYRNIICEIKIMLFKNVFKMLRGYLILMFITFIELSIGLTILGYKYSIALALLISIVDILPVLGTGTVLIPWALIELLSGNIFSGVGLILIYLLITLIRNIIEPKIIANQIGLSPIVILISMFIGIKLFGFFGMFIFPLLLITFHTMQKNGNIKIWQTETNNQ